MALVRTPGPNGGVWWNLSAAGALRQHPVPVGTTETRRRTRRSRSGRCRHRTAYSLRLRDQTPSRHSGLRRRDRHAGSPDTRSRRTLPRPSGARGRRHGDRLSRARSQARPRGRDQGPPARARRVRRHRTFLREIETRPGSSTRTSCRSSTPATPTASSTTSCRSSRASRSATGCRASSSCPSRRRCGSRGGRRRARVRPRPRGHPPGHQAREHHAARRARRGGRFGIALAASEAAAAA